jgi:hypothetical protein
MENLSREDMEAILAARAAKEKEAQAKGATELFKILDTPQSGMSRKFTFDMFGSGDEDDER